MSHVYLITGGARSGKSAYAETLAAEKASSFGVLYIATSVACDEEMSERISIHRASRPAEWLTCERYKDMAAIEQYANPDEYSVVLLDCVGNLLMNNLFEQIPDPENFQSVQFDEVERLAVSEIDALCGFAKAYAKELVFVSNEVGMGLVPETRYSRYYRDALGRLNKYIAACADEVVLMVSGLPLILKS